MKITKADVYEVASVVFSPTGLVLLLMTFIFAQYSQFLRGRDALLVLLFMYMSFLAWLSHTYHLMILNKISKIEKCQTNLTKVV
jgi:hypothetical protein